MVENKRKRLERSRIPSALTQEGRRNSAPFQAFVFRLRGVRIALVIGIVAVAASGCHGKGHAKVDGVLVPQARSGYDVPKGPTLHIPGDDLSKLPDAPIIKIAAERKVPWKQVKALIERIRAAGKQAVPLVGDRWRVRAFALSDETKGPTIAVTATPDGKSCVSPPGVDEAKCVQTVGKDQIDRAYTRRLVREAVKAYQLYDADLEVQGDITWADVVRAIDGTRTCCMDTEVRVKLDW